MELKTLKANAKNDNGKSAARRTRHSGEVPCILYGGGKAPQMLALDLREFEHVLQGRVGQHAIVQLEVESAPEMSSAALLREVQRHPTRDTILHADFQRIRLDERIHTTVPLVLVGQAKGVIEGGVLEHHLREVEVECLALEVPAQIEISVVEMALGNTLHVSHLTAPEGVTILTEADRVVAAVHVPRAMEVKAPEEAEAAEGEAAAEGDEAKEKKDDKKDDKKD